MPDTFQAYAALPGINWSTLKSAMDSMLHYDYARTHPRPDTASMSFGRMAHLLTLQPDEVPLSYVVWDKGTRRGKVWDEFVRVNEGREIVTADDYARALAVRDAVRANATAGPLITGGEAEVTITWTDPDTGLACKARLDYLRPDSITDLKTTKDPGKHAFGNTVASLHYVHQVAMQRMGVLASRGVELDVNFIAVESEPPFDVCVYPISEDDLWTATAEVKALLQRVKECEAAGEWPGRFTKAETLAVPWWAFETDDSEFDLTGLGIHKGEK